VAPRINETTAPVVLRAIPDRSRRLSDGVLIDASLRARLLGLRLLTVDATIVLVPADVRATSPTAHPPAERQGPMSSGPAPRRSVAAGPRLAQAVRSINEAADLLAESRRDRAGDVGADRPLGRGGAPAHRVASPATGAAGWRAVRRATDWGSWLGR
jgi:hypothetical protein